LIGFGGANVLAVNIFIVPIGIVCNQRKGRSIPSDLKKIHHMINCKVLEDLGEIPKNFLGKFKGNF